MALCLMNNKHYDRALGMLEKVLELEKTNEKALIRKCNCLIEVADYGGSETVLR